MTVPWYQLEPNQSEKFISVLLLRQFPNGHRRRPGRGDGGVDVLVPTDASRTVFDVYQIKYFFQRLSGSQRQQIRDSAGELLRNVRTGNIQVREWHLAMPLDPTEGDEEWLSVLFDGTEIVPHWKGLSHLDGWAADYPEVVDYYIHNGSQRLADLLDRALRMAEFRRAADGDTPISADDVTQNLSDIFAILNKDDPHYRYELAVVAAGSDITHGSTGIAMRHVSGDGRSIVMIDVIPLYEQAVTDRPIEGHLLVTIPNADRGLIDAFENFRTFGEGVTLPAGSVEAVIDDPISGLTYSDSMSITFEELPMQDPPVRRRLIVKDPRGEVQAQQPVTISRFTSGTLGGFVAEMESDKGLIRLTQRAAPKPDGGSSKVDFKASWGGRIAAQIVEEVRFAAEISEGRKLFLANEFTGPLIELAEIGEGQVLIPDWLLPYCEALANLQEFAESELKVVSPDSGSDQYIDEALNADGFRKGGIVTSTSDTGYWLQIAEIDSALSRINELNAIAYIASYRGKVAEVEVKFDDSVFFMDNIRAEKVLLDGVDYLSISGLSDTPVVMKIQREEFFFATEEAIEGLDSSQ